MSEHFKPNEHMKTAELETLLIHGDRAWNPTAAAVPPIYQTANFYGTSPDDFLERSSRPRHPEYRFGVQVTQVDQRDTGAFEKWRCGLGL